MKNNNTTNNANFSNIKSVNNLDNANCKLNTELNDNHNFYIQKGQLKNKSFDNISSENKENIFSSNLNYQQKAEQCERAFNLKNLVTSASRLVLEVLSSTVLKPNTLLSINAQGIANSLRNELDGYSYFGNENYPEYVRSI